MDYIYYHANCPDGFCAAFIAKQRYPEAALMPVTYGDPCSSENWRGKDVLVLDFSWPREIMLEAKQRCKSLLVLDHHKTAEEALRGLAFAKFDMARSGAMLAWDELMRSAPDDDPPWYVSYVQDRDLWTWKLPCSKDISAYIMSLPQTVSAWDHLRGFPSIEAAKLGAAIRRHIDEYIRKVVEQRQYGKLDGYTYAFVNAAYPNISDVGAVLCQHADVGMGWFERGDGFVQFSLRSVKDDVDVSRIAKAYGGGGHFHASGFQLPLGAALNFLNNLKGVEQ